MSEVQSRPSAPRGRGSRGRGGFSGRGARGGRGHTTNGDKVDSTPTTSIEDDGEVGQLKKKYGSKVSTIQELFPSWTDEDAVFALQETDGDLETTVERITDGTISQWGEVSKTKKDRSRSKATKDATSAAPGDSTHNARASRGGRVFEGGRGGRGRGTDRGRGGRGRGASLAQTNGSRKENADISVPTEESNAWDTTTSNAWETPKEDAPQDAPAWEAPAATPAEPAADTWGATATSTAAKVTSTIIPNGVKKSWASMFAPVPTPKKAPTPTPAPAPVEKPSEPSKPEEPVEAPAPEPEPEPEVAEKAIETPTEQIEAAPETTTFEPEAALTPSKDELTETNLEQVPDLSGPVPTATAASTAASSWDPRSGATSSTPYSALQQGQAQAIRPPTSGFVASALKATNATGRTPSYQRRVLDQEEAVRMPGNREVDRTAVQFGAFNLNGTGEEDVDGDREEPETRAQPPQHSPVAHPRASLPPAPQQAAPIPETLPTPKQSAGLPAATHPTSAPGLPSPQALPGAQTTQPGPQGNGQYAQYGRYGQGGAQEQSLPQKPYDAFSQQAPATQSPFEGYPNSQTQSHQQPQAGAFSSAPSEFSSYYTADAQRNAYNSYYQQQYAQQQGAPGQQDGSAPQQQRSYSGYNGDQAGATSQFPQSTAQQTQSRYSAGEGQNSGHTTPNPASQTQQVGQGAQPQPGHPQQPQAANYPYGHPYYSSPYYAAYMNQYQQYGGGNYGAGPYGAKAGLHGQPYQGYGMSPAAPYEHASSPAAGGFGASTLHGRDSALGGSLGDYGRAGSAQSSQTPQSIGGGAFGGGVHDAFGRNSSYQGQNQQHYNAQQGNQTGTGDDLKPFGEAKAANGPSPSLSQANRPGSATNAAPGSALPPPQSAQQGYGGYPSHLQQQGHGLHGQAGSQYGGLGGAGAHQAAGQGHQSSQYGGYQGFGGYNYGNSQQRGGWGGNYGH